MSIGYVDPESDGGLEQDLASRRYRALLPEEEDDSDEQSDSEYALCATLLTV